MHLTRNCLIELHFFISPIHVSVALWSFHSNYRLTKPRYFLNEIFSKFWFKSRIVIKTFLLMIVTWSHPCFYCSLSSLASGWASPSFLRFPVSQFSFISFHHFASWIKKMKFLCPEPHRSFTRCRSFLFLFPYDFFYPIADLYIFFYGKRKWNQILWWWWGLMKWFYSTSCSFASQNVETSF